MRILGGNAMPVISVRSLAGRAEAARVLAPVHIQYYGHFFLSRLGATREALDALVIERLANVFHNVAAEVPHTVDELDFLHGRRPDEGFLALVDRADATSRGTGVADVLSWHI
jgi:hypothetical protein